MSEVAQAGVRGEVFGQERAAAGDDHNVGDLRAIDHKAAGLGLAQVAPERGVVAQCALGAGVRLGRLGALGLGALGLDPLELCVQAALATFRDDGVSLPMAELAALVDGLRALGDRRPPDDLELLAPAAVIEPAGPPAQCAEAAPPMPEPAATTAPLIEWPPDGQRQIVALRIVAASEERLSGRAVRLAITACGFVHGRFGIFHQPDADGRALLSVASLSKPGVLDPINMDFQRLAGISLFTVLPGPLPPAAALDHLIDIARELSQRLPARLQDEHGRPLDADRLEDLRDSMQRLSRQGIHAEPAA